MDRLARTGDWSKEAAGPRLEAAIRASGLRKQHFADRSGQKLTAVINATKGRSHPSRESMQWLFRNYRVDPAFILAGEYANLPDELRTRVFAALEALDSGPDQPSD